MLCKACYPISMYRLLLTPTLPHNRHIQNNYLSPYASYKAPPAIEVTSIPSNTSQFPFWDNQGITPRFQVVGVPFIPFRQGLLVRTSHHEISTFFISKIYFLNFLSLNIYSPVPNPLATFRMMPKILPINHWCGRNTSVMRLSKIVFLPRVSLMLPRIPNINVTPVTWAWRRENTPKGVQIPSRDRFV